MIIFDTETTDLIKSLDLPDRVQPRIIEFYAMKVKKARGGMGGGPAELEQVDVLEFICDPGAPIEELTTKITGITQADVAGQGPFAQHLKTLQDFFLGEELVIGHNVTYDLDMLFLELRRLEAVTKFPWPPKRLCTVEATEHFEGKRLKLVDLHKRLFDGEGFEAHRAKADVEATFRCLKALRASGEIKL